MIIVHACTMIIIHACNKIIVHACPQFIVNACTIIVHACTLTIIYVSYSTGLMFRDTKDGGPGDEAPQESKEVWGPSAFQWSVLPTKTHALFLQGFQHVKV